LELRQDVFRSEDGKDQNQQQNQAQACPGEALPWGKGAFGFGQRLIDAPRELAEEGCARGGQVVGVEDFFFNGKARGHHDSCRA